MSEHNHHISTISQALAAGTAKVLSLIQQQELIAEIVESGGDLNQYFELSLFNPLLQTQRFKELERHKTEPQEKKPQIEKTEKTIAAIQRAEEAASRFQRNNEELRAKTLLILRSQIKPADTPDEILQKVLTIYPDPSLADEALDFLIETADPELVSLLREAKEKLNATRKREIVAGRNMGAQAREFAKEGLGSPTSLRDLYRDITGVAREPIDLFNELTEKFPYAKLKSAIDFLLHSMGSDLKSKGSSIAPGELKRLIDETRSLQGILGVFRFFQSRMRLINRLLQSYNFTPSSRINFETLGKIFIRIVAERYINPEKILQTAQFIGLSEEVAAQLVIYAQMRDALKQIAPRYFRNSQHRDELSKAFLDTLDQLEDELEEEEEEEKKKKEKESEE